MLRVRFLSAAGDYRPVKWPYPHPYWCTGHNGDNTTAVLVAYADDEDQILEYWPEAEGLEVEEVESYVFTDRFPRPSWFREDADAG